MPNTPAPMTLVEQRNKLLNVAKEAIKYAHAYGASQHASLVGTQRVSSFIGLTERLIAQIESQIAGESKQGDPAFRKTAWDLKALLALPADERDEILRKAAEQGASVYAWATCQTPETEEV